MRSILVIAVFLMASGCESSRKADVVNEAPVAIGQVHMTSDRALVIELFRDADGRNFHAMNVVKPGDPRYDEELAHVGEVQPDGVTKLYYAWPDE